VILWKDFVLDDQFGPSLHLAGAEDTQVGRETRFGNPSVMEDANRVSIQETRQDSRPARMVGYSSLDSHTHGMEADQGSRTVLQQREGG
jgi:hypothetical protein